jgi:hypothetical protein
MATELGIPTANEAVPEPVALDPVSMERLFRTNRARDEKVIYYRAPEMTVRGLPYPNPKWISWADSQPAKRLALMARGFTPLPQFGRIIETDAEAWVLILKHPQGPAQFPTSQVITFRWYRPEYLPGSLQGARIRFPQLIADARDGLTIKEYFCPECTNRWFFEPYHLARHLTNGHGYDRASIIALGKELGIDFMKTIFRLVEPVNVYGLETEAAPEPELMLDPDDMPLPVEPIRPPSTLGATFADAGVSELDHMLEDAAPAQPSPTDVLPVTAADMLLILRKLEDMDARINAMGQTQPPSKLKRTLSPEAAERSRRALERAREAKMAKREAAVVV